MLSILPNAGFGSITYYDGDDANHLSHLKNCKLICKKRFNIDESVEQIVVEDPQLHFYKLSNKVSNTYIFNNNLDYKVGENCEIHKTATIGVGVKIGDNVEIGPNVVIYSHTTIGNNVTIDSNCTIGTEGMMWVWDNNKKVYLRQLGGVFIEDNVRICSNCVIVRGSANELTIIRKGSNLAPGCCIGHGTEIGEHVHFANNISTGGSTKIAGYNFVGSGVVFRAGVRVTSNDVIIGAGSVVSTNIDNSGVYVGVPARWIKKSEGKLNGMPKWRR